MQTNASVVENVSKIAPVVYCQLQMTARIFVSVLPIRTFVSDVKDVQDFVQNDAIKVKKSHKREHNRTAIKSRFWFVFTVFLMAVFFFFSR